MRCFTEDNKDKLEEALRELARYAGVHTHNEKISAIDDPEVYALDYIDRTRNFLRIKTNCKVHREFLYDGKINVNAFNYTAYIYCEDYEDEEDLICSVTDNFAIWLDEKCMGKRCGKLR